MSAPGQGHVSVSGQGQMSAVLRPALSACPRGRFIARPHLSRMGAARSRPAIPSQDRDEQILPRAALGQRSHLKADAADDPIF